MVLAEQDRRLPGIEPLTARSVVLSTLLGYHPPALPVSLLVRVGGLFGIAETTTRVAVTRMVADGDLVGDRSVYRLSERLVRRQRQQDESCSPRTKVWEGSWEMAIVTAASRPLAERVALRKAMQSLRLAELREGVWLRPANLERRADGIVAEQCTFFESIPKGRLVDLAGSLWDLPAWAAEATRLSGKLDAGTLRTGTLVAGFMTTAEVFRHLLLDPALPPELLPPAWPGTTLRDRFTEFKSSYAALLRNYGEANEPPRYAGPEVPPP